MVDQLARFESADQIRCDACSNLDFLTIDYGEHNYARLQFVFDLIHGVTQAFGVHAFELRGQHFYAVYLFRLVNQIVSCRGGQLRFQLRKLLL